MANTDDRLESRKAYLARLAHNLVSLGEAGFRKLCDELGDDYDRLPGEEVPLRAVRWIDKLEVNGLIPSLVNYGKANYPGYIWDDPALAKQYPPSKYFVATALKEFQTLEQFKIAGDRFERTRNPKEADYLIFDLDHPPADWIKYLGSQEHVFKGDPYYETTIFVRLSSVGDLASKEVELGGNDIFTILRKLFPGGYEFNLSSSTEELLLKLATLEDNRSKREQFGRGLNRQTLASLHQEGNG